MAHPRERRNRPQGISRRDFIRRSAGAAVLFGGAGTLLEACVKASNPDAAGPPTASSTPAFQLARPDNPVKWPIFDDNPPIESGLQPEANATLKIYNWEDYLWPRLVKNFCAEVGCKYELTTFGGVDEALIRSNRLRPLTDPRALLLEKKTGQGERTRRDPALLVDLMLGAADGEAE